MAKKEGMFSAITGAFLHKDKDKDKKSPRPDDKFAKDKRGSERGERPTTPKIAVTEAEQPIAKSIPAGMLRVYDTAALFLPDDQSLLVVQQSDQTLADLFVSVQKKYPMLLRDPTIWEFRGGATPGVYSYPQWPNVVVGSRNQIALMKHINNSPRSAAAVASPSTIAAPKPTVPAAVPPSPTTTPPTPAVSGSPAPDYKLSPATHWARTPVSATPHTVGAVSSSSSLSSGRSSPSLPSPATPPVPAVTKQGSPKQQSPLQEAAAAPAVLISPAAAGSAIARPIRVRVGEHGAELDVHMTQANAQLSAVLHQLEVQLQQHMLSLPAPAAQCEFRMPSGRPLRLDDIPPQNVDLLTLVPRELVITLPDCTAVKLTIDDNTTVLHLVSAVATHRAALNTGNEWVLVSADEADVLTMSSATAHLLEICPNQRAFSWRHLHRRFLPGPEATWINSMPMTAAETTQRTLFGTLARSFAEDIVLSPGRVCLPVELWSERMPIPHQQIKTQLLEWLSDTLARLRFVASPQRSTELDTLKQSLIQISEHLTTLLASRSSIGTGLMVPRAGAHARSPSTGGPSSLKEIQQRPITVPTFLIGVQNFVNAMCSFLEVYRSWSASAGEVRKLFAEVLELIDRIVVRGFMMDDIFLHMQKYLRRSVEEML